MEEVRGGVELVWMAVAGVDVGGGVELVIGF